MKKVQKSYLIVVINNDGTLGKIFQRNTRAAAIIKATDEAHDLDQGYDYERILKNFDDVGTEWNSEDNGRVVLCQAEDD